MTLAAQHELHDLQQWFDDVQSALVAYSGGVDSSLVMAVAHQQLADRALACIAVSPSYPVREMRQAVKLSKESNVSYRLIHTQEHLVEDYAANPQNRCYFCKTELFGQLRKIADLENWQMILDGTNASDLADDRPGKRAGDEYGVRSPLAELGLTKPQVRRLAHHLGLTVWDKPAMACLSSRVPHGTPITPQLLRQIERAEDVLYEQGFRQFRVRHHSQVARIELPAEDLDRAIEKRAALLAGIHAAGYRFVCLDLASFRSSSLHIPQTDETIHLTVKGQA